MDFRRLSKIFCVADLERARGRRCTSVCVCCSSGQLCETRNTKRSCGDGFFAMDADPAQGRRVDPPCTHTCIAEGSLCPEPSVRPQGKETLPPPHARLGSEFAQLARSTVSKRNPSRRSTIPTTKSSHYEQNAPKTLTSQSSLHRLNRFTIPTVTPSFTRLAGSKRDMSCT
ncbi:hypothetical protein IQ06DRAFT_21366 [Phaeosphaeriaceae sp. SRC1lsM3a]|nr:hypothetical protein IQ06DRAFT_21366 [Stagonospora sp. SRC1lsM3a]